MERRKRITTRMKARMATKGKMRVKMKKMRTMKKRKMTRHSQMLLYQGTPAAGAGAVYLVGEEEVEDVAKIAVSRYLLLDTKLIPQTNTTNQELTPWRFWSHPFYIE